MKKGVTDSSSRILSICHNLVAYFSMEIGFENDIPTYSGGLGILAGDTVKSLADLGVDSVAITLLSEKGYFYQSFDEHNLQLEKDYNWNVANHLKKLDVQVVVNIEGSDVKVNVWEYSLKGIRDHVVKILFLDTNVEGNPEVYKTLTSHLYGGDSLYRLRQEMILGLGGVKVLRALSLYPKKYHMNEGHAAFLIKELFDELSNLSSKSDKRSLIRTLCSFTTHTPVAAGHDSFDKNVLLKEFSGNFPEELLSFALEGEKFSMTRLALNFSSYVNAVARKHQEVSKRMFPDFSIDYITNGIHSITWTNKHHASLFDKYIVDWRVNSMELRNALKIPIDEIILAHEKAKQELVDYINTTTNAGFEYDVFTIGFARRATAYKRAELLFNDIGRLKQISSSVGKIQIVFAGKAHPNDFQGKAIIKHIRELAEELSPEIKIVFLDNYNMFIGKLMTGGVDVWLNTPKRPLEASGTSGMKAAVNGVPSLSIPDGWWIEGLIEGFTGWAIGSEFVTGLSDQQIDDLDANLLYEKLEQTIIPLFYNDFNSYAKIMRYAIAINAAYFNTHRMVKQYLVRAYTRNN